MSQSRSGARQETRRSPTSPNNPLSSTHQRTRAQTAAYLLGIRPELPNVNDEEVSCMNAVQIFYEGMADQPIKELTAEQYQDTKLDKIEFQVPLHTTDTNKSTTYVDRLHSESESQQDIFDSIKATMDVPDKYEHLGWRLSTACRTDPPHRLLTVHDIDSAFRDARAAKTSGRQCKKIAIVIINTKPTPKEKPTKQRTSISSASEQGLLPPGILVISDEAPVGQQGNFLPQSLKRTYALYLDSDEESSNDEPSQNITDVMTSIHSRYPAMNFRQYDGKLKDRGILYLSTAAHFDEHSRRQVWSEEIRCRYSKGAE
ncbi:uncharacterized protein HD556DRAFT_1459774 [Suillus plorans]|uniref:Uncharacterized protein n=1 Tax=Suillus plorans TaxID=116603 RepID=A0A9P7ABE1_9AGAM|nr:uncharacterized protein HD556DRAFT_1459774 [Suillus plorans]KAG1785082.1 hypothetical protein HD556DRAFT_1459774 [Suillus plorans]